MRNTVVIRGKNLLTLAKLISLALTGPGDVVLDFLVGNILIKAPNIAFNDKLVLCEKALRFTVFGQK